MNESREEYFYHVYKECLTSLIKDSFGFDPVDSIETVVDIKLKDVENLATEDKKAWKLFLEKKLLDFYLEHKDQYSKFKQ